MSHPLAYLNGHFLPHHELRIRPQDMGFMLGVTVAEQLRTFGGKLFDWTSHLDRLRRSLAILGLPLDLSTLEQAAHELVDHNHALLPLGSDLGLTVFVTPGIYPTYQGDEAGDVGPTVGLHTYELPFHQWASKYTDGQRCRVVNVPQVSTQCWPRELKCRSRIHYYLADREAQAMDPASRAILLDDGHLNEASTANVLVVFDDESIVSPRLETVLPGVSLQFTETLAADVGINFRYRDIVVEELRHAREMLLTSTPFCMLPVSRLDDRALEVQDAFSKLMSAWSDRVGIDVVAQARQFSS